MAWSLDPTSPTGAVRAHVADALGNIASYADPAVWIHRASAAEVNAQLEDALRRRDRGERTPLLGLVVAVKDNIDVAGMPTTAACPAFSYVPEQSATVVTRLTDAGAVIAGKTNLDQFATGLVGTRSPYGACRNVYDDRYISGGSSSGSAVAVAAGLVDASLGTDTAGSGRVPAAFNNVVGLKPTKGLLSTTGVVPACRSLDCVSIFAPNVALAERVFEVARGFDARDVYSRRPGEIPARAMAATMRLGIPASEQLEFFGNQAAERLYFDAVNRAIDMGATPVTIDFAPFRDAARLLYEGPWVAERLAAIKTLLSDRPHELLPVTRQIIAGGDRYSAVDAFEATYRLLELRRAAEAQFERMDAMLLPTTGTIYTIAEVEAEPLKLNTNLGYYTNFVNLLDLCAVAVPAGFQSNGLPAGVTFMVPAGEDEYVCAVGRKFLGEEASS